MCSCMNGTCENIFEISRADEFWNKTNTSIPHPDYKKLIFNILFHPNLQFKFKKKNSKHNNDDKFWPNQKDNFNR